MNIPAPFSQNQMRFFWNCFDHWFNVAEGGKRGGKNVLITMAYCTIHRLRHAQSLQHGPVGHS